MAVSAVIVAAGSSKRMDNGVDKLSVRVNGKPLIAWTISRFESADSVDEIIIVAREDSLDFVEELVNGEGFGKINSVVAGGAHRQNSTKNGIMALSRESEVVLIHDGSRPLVHPSDIDSLTEDVYNHGASLLATKCNDTIKEVENGKIVKTIKRDSLWSAQTPQGFRKDIIAEALAKAERDGFIGTDEASLVERMNIEISIVEGRRDNIKVTVQEDLKFVERYFRDNAVNV